MKVDLRGWHSRNMWHLPSGEFATRPGLREVFTLASSHTIHAAFSVLDHAVNEYWHYIICTQQSDSQLVLIVYDQDASVVQQFPMGTTAVPRAVSWGTTLNELVISSPDFPMLWGIVGGPLGFAGKEPSDNEVNTPAIEIPRGIGIAWASRYVVLDGANIFFSDPVDILGGSPRTFTGVAAQWRPGTCFGIHTDRSGNLIVCTTTGTYRLDKDAAAAGQEPVGEWQLISHHKTTSYRSTAAYNGRIFGLTRRGYRLVDEDSSPEIPLDDPIIPLTVPRIGRLDWRGARMVEGEFGPIITSPEHEHFLMIDVDRGFSSWWQYIDGAANKRFDVVGSLTRHGGEELPVTTSHALRVFGNMDGGKSAYTEYTQTPARLYGTVPVGPEESPTFRGIDVGSSSQASMSVAFRGGAAYTEASEETVEAPIIDTTAWDAAGVLWGSPKLRAHRFDFDEDETRDPSFELQVTGNLERVLPEVFLHVDGLAKRRPT